MRSTWWNLCLVVLAAASCGFPRLPDLPVGPGGDDDGTNDGGPPTLELLAGNPDGPGSVDGTGGDARFNGPQSVAIDGVGNVYVADSGNGTLRKVTPTGVVTTLAGTPGTRGSADGAPADARFNGLLGIAVDSAGNVYVGDGFNATVRKVSPTRVVTTLAGTAGMFGSRDDTGAAARFTQQGGVAVDSVGNVYVADMNDHTIRKITAAGVVTTLAGTAGTTGSVDGTGPTAHFSFPAGVAVDSAGNVYVTDFQDSTLRKITPTGITTTIAGAPGVARVVLGTAPRLAFPFFLTVVGDSIAIVDNNAVLLLRHGARP